MSEQDEAAERLELIREGVTMALYIGLSLLAVLLALPTATAEGNDALPLLVLVTAIGLVLAHQVAFRLSTRLVSGGILPPGAVRVLGAQWVGGGAVVLLAMLPLLIGGPDGLPWSRFLLLALVAVVGYLAMRSGDASRWRAIVYVAGLVVVVLIVLGIKGLAGH